jgi:hypothetical protein
MVAMAMAMIVMSMTMMVMSTMAFYNRHFQYLS